MPDESAFDFGTANAVSGNVEDVVNSPCDPVIAVFIAIATIASEVISRVRPHVHVEIAVVIAEDRACHSRPRFFHGKNSTFAVAEHLRARIFVQHCEFNAEKWQSSRSGLSWCAGRRSRTSKTIRSGENKLSENHSTSWLGDSVSKQCVDQLTIRAEA